jgi:hypothetical protein
VSLRIHIGEEILAGDRPITTKGAEAHTTIIIEEDIINKITIIITQISSSNRATDHNNNK